MIDRLLVICRFLNRESRIGNLSLPTFLRNLRFLKNVNSKPLRSPKLSPEPPPCPPILGGSEIEVPQNWGLKSFQAYMKREQVQDLKHLSDTL